MRILSSISPTNAQFSFYPFEVFSILLAAGADPRTSVGATNALSLANASLFPNFIQMVKITLAQWALIVAANTSSVQATLTAATANSIQIDERGALSIFIKLQFIEF